MARNSLATPDFSSHLVGGFGVFATITGILSAIHAQVALRRIGLSKPHLFTIDAACFYICKFALARHARLDAWINLQFGGDPGKWRLYAIDC